MIKLHILDKIISGIYHQQSKHYITNKVHT